MSFNIYVTLKKKNSKKVISSHQLLGNNEDYLPLTEEFKRQGVVIPDEYDCYNGKLYDIDSITKVLEQYIFDKEKDIQERYHSNIFDLSIRTDEERKHFTYTMKDHQECAYIFASSNFINFLEKYGALDLIYTEDGDKFILKDDYELYVNAG